jgi:hypothetical protein
MVVLTFHWRGSLESLKQKFITKWAHLEGWTTEFLDFLKPVKASIFDLHVPPPLVENAHHLVQQNIDYLRHFQQKSYPAIQPAKLTHPKSSQRNQPQEEQRAFKRLRENKEVSTFEFVTGAESLDETE